MRTKLVKCDATTLLVKNASSHKNLTPETRNRIQVSGMASMIMLAFSAKIRSMQDITPLFMLSQIKPASLRVCVHTKANQQLSEFENHDCRDDGIDRG